MTDNYDRYAVGYRLLQWSYRLEASAGRWWRKACATSDSHTREWRMEMANEDTTDARDTRATAHDLLRA
jgi:hypothetical protein